MRRAPAGPSPTREPSSRRLASSVLAGLLAGCATLPPRPGAARLPPREGPFAGSWTTRYRARLADEDQDHELKNVLALDYADAERPRLRGHLLARLDVDLDGLDEGPAFQDLSDTYDERVVGRLYAASLEVALDGDAEEGSRLWIGRRTDPELPEVLRLDGLAYRSRPFGARALQLGLYAGIPAHQYESRAGGEHAFGSSLAGRPWTGGQARLDWMHLEDELVLGPERDDLVALGFRQALEGRGWLEGEHARLDGRARDLGLRALYDDPGSGLVARLAYRELLETQVVNTLELDPFSTVLQELAPFRQLSLALARDLGARFGLELGFDLRRVLDPADVGDFNREWERYRAMATVHDLAREGLTLSLTADRWDDPENDVSALGADLTLAPAPSWRASLGSTFSLYKYSLLELSEREDVRTYYLGADCALSDRSRLDFAYELEDDGLETTHTLRWGARWRF